MFQNIASKLLVVGLCLSLSHICAQVPPNDSINPNLKVELRFDQAKSEELADIPVDSLSLSEQSASDLPTLYKLNRRKVSYDVVIDGVTLWNVRRVSIKKRRMRLSDTTERENVRMIKFLVQRTPRKGVRPHLRGNVAGYGWVSYYVDADSNWHSSHPYINLYTLHRDYDSMRRVDPKFSLHQIPPSLYYTLPRNAIYVLNGERVPCAIFQCVNGLTLQTLDIYQDQEAAALGYDRAVVIGDTYPNREPLVLLDGRPSTIQTWLRIASANSFDVDAAVPMHYRYVLPVDAVRLYGKSALYGAIFVGYAQ